MARNPKLLVAYPHMLGALPRLIYLLVKLLADVDRWFLLVRL